MIPITAPKSPSRRESITEGVWGYGAAERIIGPLNMTIIQKMENILMKPSIPDSAIRI